MNLDKVYNNIREYTEKIGIHPMSDPGINCELISCFDSEEEGLPDLDAIELFLAKMASYNMYLKSLKGSLEAQVLLHEAEFNRVLALQTQNITKQFMTAEEKKALALSQNSELLTLNTTLLTTRAKFIKLKDIPFAIDKKIELLKLKYKRMLDEQQQR